jgi:hypothetical protein
MPDLDLGTSQTMKKYEQKHLLLRDLFKGNIFIVWSQRSMQISFLGEFAHNFLRGGGGVSHRLVVPNAHGRGEVANKGAPF